MKRTIVAGVVTVGAWAFPSSAAALTCPASFGGDPDVTRQYTVDPATACAWGDGNLAQGNDDFLDGNIDGSIGTVGTGWTNVEYTESGGNGAVLDLNSDGTWTITGALANTDYLIGIVDGDYPKWAVFLVGTATSGTWSINKDPGGVDLSALSHIALYSRDGDGGGGGGGSPPEPASLTLFGLGMLGAAYRLRKRAGR